MPQRTVSFVVSENEVGLRLDRLLVAHAPGLGRRRAKELFASGAATLAGRRARAGDLARAGDEIHAVFEDDAAVPEPSAALDVRLELAELVVVEKPAGQPSAPLAPGELGTLANALVARYPEMAGVGYRQREPGLVHRLDTQTSGLLVAARSQASFEALKAALSSGRLEKRYLAVVPDRGLAQQGTIESALGVDPKRPERVLVTAELPPDGYARACVTRYFVRQRGRGRLLLEVEAPQAMRHQIRAHLASIGHPIVGDATYGGELDPTLGARHALHASYIACAGDRTLPRFEVRSALPDLMRSLVDELP